MNVSSPESCSLQGRLAQSTAAIRAELGAMAQNLPIGLILGSGLGDVADALPHAVRMPAPRIPHMPAMGVAGHGGALVLASVAGQTIACWQGRPHYYEGHDLSAVTYPVRVLHALGVRTLIVTNAAGGVNPAFLAGDLMLIADHLNLMGAHPLRGPNDDTLGPRFPDMTAAYDPDLRQLAHDAARTLGLTLREGVYAAMAGPSYETPAEVRMLATLGADAVGMSTVPEVLVARHGGMRVLGLSCIANAAAGLSETPLSHAEVLAAGERAKPAFAALLHALLTRLGAHA